MYYLTNTADATIMEARETIPGISQAVPEGLERHVFSMLGLGRSCRVVDGVIQTSSQSSPCDGCYYDWDAQSWVNRTEGTSS